jgi:hypothetical protein
MIQLSVLAVGLAGVDDCCDGDELQELKPTTRAADMAASLKDAPSTSTRTSRPLRLRGAIRR